jgi:hypothetical protein
MPVRAWPSLSVHGCNAAEKRRAAESVKLRHKSDVVVQIALLAENEKLQTILGTYGIATQTQQQIEPVFICPPSKLIDLYSQYVPSERSARVSSFPCMLAHA